VAAVEVSQALISATKAKMVTDSDLQTLVSLSATLLSKRIHYIEAFADPGEDEEPKEFFIAHEVDLDYDTWPNLSGRYIQTINDYADNAGLLLQVVKRIKELFIEARLSPPDGEFSACRVWPLGSANIPKSNADGSPSDPLRWQHSIIWQVSLFAKGEVQAVLER